MESFIKDFKQLNLKDTKIAGGKGASLGELVNIGMNVPKGFVIISEAFNEYVLNSGIGDEIFKILGKTDYKSNKSVDTSSKKILDSIRKIKFNEEFKDSVLKRFNGLKMDKVAVRSSATAEDSIKTSWAGELETFLNIGKKELFSKIVDCWGSLYSPRAIIYSKENRLNYRNIKVAVIIQEMIDPEVSGITFTVHPVLKNKNLMIIEAGYGLGEAIVSGSITPDSYIVNKKAMLIEEVEIGGQEKYLHIDPKGNVRWKLLDKKMRDKQKLKGMDIIDLSKTCLKIEKHYKRPQDIEWCRKDNKTYILQSRPITTI
jgi:pyruvate, water dikinase